MRWRIVAVLACLLAVYPIASGAARTTARIAVVKPLPPTNPVAARSWKLLAAKLRQRGWVEGKNLTVSFYAPNADTGRYPEVAAKPAGQRPDLIIAAGQSAVRAVQKQTKTIPIVMYGVPDPVKLGFIASMARPGGNITGVSPETEDVFGKGVQLLTELHPGITRVAYLAPGAPRYLKAATGLFNRTARRLHLAPWMTALRQPGDFGPAFAAAAKQHPDAMVVSAVPLFLAQRRKIAAFAIRERLPTLTFNRFMVQEGLLMAYHADFPGEMQRVAAIVDKVLHGAEPADIPFEQPTKFDLSINLKTARAIGLDVPRPLLARADELIR